MNNLLNKLFQTHILSKDELILLLNDNSINDELFALADSTRQKHVGDEVHLRGLIEFSNTCLNNCKYCGLRCENKKIIRYNLTYDDIINSAKTAKNAGYKTLVLQSGENKVYSVSKIQKIISELKKMDFAITLSIGEKTFEEYKAYKEAGTDRYLLRIETTDKNLYAQMHPDMDFENRVRCLKDLRKLNYEVGSGFLVGLPNQNISSTADDLLFLKELKVDMAGIGPFIPNPDTPLYNVDNIDKNTAFTLSLKAMAIMRLLLPEINIPATTAMEALNANGRIKALQSGANVIMPNVTDFNFQEKYLLYPGKVTKEQDTTETLKYIKNKLKSINRPIATDYGTSKAFLKIK